MVVSSTEDIKPAPSLPPQRRSAPSKPSPLRNAVLGAGVPKDTHHDEQRANGQEKTPPAQARVQVGRLPQQESSSEREVPLPLPGQFDVAPLALPPSDPDLDSYFNDEDNDAFLAVKDSAMHGIESSDALGTIGSSGQGVIRSANLNSEISRGGSHPVPVSVRTSDAHVPAPPSDKPISTLRQAIAASLATATTATAGVKRPAETMRSIDRMTEDRGTPVPPIHRSPYGRRAPLSDLPIEESTDAKRVRR